MGEEKKNFKDTLNLPKTDFPIRAGLKQREPEIEKKLIEADIYQLSLNKNAGKQRFVLHDGPPYPNGDIHLGHALNKTLKDIVVKYKTMQGLESPFIPGWDCHGLPIETQLLKELKKKQSEESPVKPTEATKGVGVASPSSIEKAEFREKCKEYALGYVEKQKEQFKRLGIRGDWENPYLTLQPEYEAAVIEVFSKLATDGYVYKGSKPIHWCAECKTALAEAEIEYEDHKSPSIYTKFIIEGTQATKKEFNEIKKQEIHQILPEGVQASLIVWTTTPWTLPANVAVAVNPSMTYAVTKETKSGEIYILAESLIEKVKEIIGFELEIQGKLQGTDLEGIVCHHPFVDRTVPVVVADYVTDEDGTGCVHIAPGHGQDDHVVGQKYDLPTLMPVDDAGVFTDEAGKFAGMHIDEANKAITKHMEELGVLLKLVFIKHSYPHCWRCKSPVIFRATPQWFISMDHEGSQGKIREKALKGVEDTTWHPSWGRNRIFAMIENRPDWCISRQRSWGVPIPIFYCKKCGEAQFEKDFFDAVIEAVKKEGTNVWFTKEADEILPESLTCKCGHNEFDKESDIMDVWLESGASQAAVLKNNDQLKWPADLYLEGSDQHRGWFHSSMLLSVGENGSAPYKNVLTHGFTIDDKGRKMSKSLGNVVSALKTIDNYGADILRLWVASTNFKNDLAVSDNILKQVQDSFTKIRNTWRFMLSNLYDHQEYKDLIPFDRYIISKLQKLIKVCTKAYEEYEFHKIYHSVHDFCCNDLSAFYLDINKDNLYCNKDNAPERRSCQQALMVILTTLTKIMSPILTYTTEDIHSFIKEIDKQQVFLKNNFAQLEDFPMADESLMNTKLEEKYDKVLKLREAAYKLIEEKRAAKEIASSNEAEVIITDKKEIISELDPFELEKIFIVSKVELKEGEPQIEAKKYDGQKCVRCWRLYAELNQDEICPRCHEAAG